MKLLVSCIPYDGGKSGISVYTREVVRGLLAQGHELTLLCEPGEGGVSLSDCDVSDVRDARDESSLTSLTSHVSCQKGPSPVVSAPRWSSRPIFSMLWHLFVLPFWIWRRRRGFDGFVICAANRRVCAWYPLPTAATVHDLANFHIPGKYSRSRMFYLAHVLPFFAKRAQRLVAVSGATKADMVKFWGVAPERVTVLYNGLSDEGDGRDLRDQRDGRDNGDARVIASISSIANIPSSRATILYISRIEHPGKNHVRLIEAYSRLPRDVAEKHPLVIAGADWKDAGAVHEAAAKSPYADMIRFTGFVEDRDIPKLWAEAGFYVFPSLFEGFGLSLVEAMARGIPCACSNNGSLGEIAGDVAVTFDPESVDEIAAALEKLLNEAEADRAARVARGYEWIRRFSWADHARGIARLIEEAMGHEGRESREGHEGSRLSRLSRLSSQETASLFGIPVARVTESEAVERIVEFAKRRHCEKDNRLTTNDYRPTTKFVATLNVDFVTNAVRGWPFGGNDELWGYLRNADLVTADGMPIVLLSRLLRRRLPERVTGADMVPAICRRCAEEGLSVYVLGGNREAVEEAFGKLKIENGKLIVAGIDDSFVKLDRDQPEIVERINAAKPDILFVALGNPKQELWMGRNLSRLDVGVAIGIGGTFNFIAGRVKRAPRWMQKSGLEWIYRIVQEPGRLWRRYAYGLVKFSWLSLLHLLGGYRR